MRQASLLLALLLSLLAGCAETTTAPRRLPRPEDFPFHATDHPFFDVHWRLDRVGDKVEAVGLVEAARADDAAVVVVQLLEVDAGGQVINRALARTYRPVCQSGTASFNVSLRPKSQGNQFKVGIWTFSWAPELGC